MLAHSIKQNYLNISVENNIIAYFLPTYFVYIFRGSDTRGQNENKTSGRIRKNIKDENRSYNKAWIRVPTKPMSVWNLLYNR